MSWSVVVETAGCHPSSSYSMRASTSSCGGERWSRRRRQRLHPWQLHWWYFAPCCLKYRVSVNLPGVSWVRHHEQVLSQTHSSSSCWSTGCCWHSLRTRRPLVARFATATCPRSPPAVDTCGRSCGQASPWCSSSFYWSESLLRRGLIAGFKNCDCLAFADSKLGLRSFMILFK